MSTYTTLIKNGKIVDGTGNVWFYGDVAFDGEQIAAITPRGQIDPQQAAEVVEATGLVVCPGFIDILSHSILPLMVDGRSLSKITQGVTTEIMGEGWTPAPFAGEDDLISGAFFKLIPEWLERMRGWSRFRDWLEAMVETGVSPNVGSFLGGGTLRQYGRGLAMGPSSAEELETMRRVMHESLEQGAFGVSYALIYPPSAYVDTEELIEICKVVRQHGGLYISHLRSEADGFMEGVEEALTIGQQADVPIQIYHLKAAGQRNWPKLMQVIERINQARAQGQDVTADMYPYPAAGTGLASVLPPWAAAEGKYYDNLRDPAMRAKIRAEVLNPSGDWEAMADLCSPEGVMPIGFQKPEHQPYIGKSLAEIAEMRQQDWLEAVFDLSLAEGQRISTIYFMMNEENVRLKLQQPWIMIGTDAGGLDPAWAAPLGPYHPRAYGSYSRILGKYVREEGVISLEEAVRKMSSAVANRLNLPHRGVLRVGFQADVVIFDPQTIGDKATFADPHHLSVGVRDVWVNGKRVLADGKHTSAKPGQIVSGAGLR